MGEKEHPFSWQAIGRIITAGLVILLAWKSIGVLTLIVLSAMFATALYPLVVRLDRKLPLLASSVLVVCLLLVPFILLGLTVIPNLVNQLPGLLAALDIVVNKSPIVPQAVRNIDLTQYAENAVSYVLLSTTFVTSFFTSIFTVFFLTFYFLFDGKRLANLMLSVFPENQQKSIEKLLLELARVNGHYLRGALFVASCCGLTIFIGLTLLNVPFAGPIAIFTALLDLLPLIGLPFAMIPAAMIGFTVSPLTSLLVITLYLIYQQVEGIILAPTVYNKTLHISPSLGFLALIIGTSLFGFIGTFFALPAAASLPAIIKFLREEQNKINNQQ